MVSWIAPSAESYGIHGTPEPGKVSNGIARLNPTVKDMLLIVDNPALLFELCLETNSRATFGTWNGSGQAVRGFVDGAG